MCWGGEGAEMTWLLTYDRLKPHPSPLILHSGMLQYLCMYILYTYSVERKKYDRQFLLLSHILKVPFDNSISGIVYIWIGDKTTQEEAIHAEQMGRTMFEVHLCVCVWVWNVDVGWY